MSQFERCFTLKRSICTQPGGQMTHNNGTRLCAPRQLVVWVSSQGPPLVRSHARLHTAAQAASPTAVPAVAVHLGDRFLPLTLPPHQLPAAPRKEKAHLPERCPLHQPWRADSSNDH